MATITELLNSIKQRLQTNIETGRVHDAQISQRSRDLGNQFSHTINSLVDFQHPSLLGPIGQVKPARKFLLSIPEVNLTHYADNIQSPVARFVPQLVLGGAQSLINTPRSLTGGVLRTENAVSSHKPIQQVLGAATEPAEGLLNLLTLGEGSSVMGAKQGWQQLVKEGAINGAKYGSMYGGLGGLKRNENAGTLGKQVISSIPDVAVGAGVGSVLGGGLGLTSSILDSVLFKGKTEDLNDPVVQRVLTTPEAKKVLKEWMNESYAQTNARRGAGLTPQEAYGNAKTAVETVVKSEKFNSIFAKWIGKRDAAKTAGATEAWQLKSIPNELFDEIVNYMEGGKSKNQEVVNITKGLRTRFDELYREAKAAGLDVNYLKDYITHFWKQTPEEVQAAYKGAGTRIGKRYIATYAEGKEVGLTPKYDNPAQMLGEYSRRIQEMKANLELINSLKKEGLIVPAGKAEAGMMPLTGPGFPKSTTVNANGERVLGSYYADSKIANTINKVFSPDEAPKWTDIGAKISSGIQDVGLAGGIPGTPLNAWTFSQILSKELPAGRVRGPLKALSVAMGDSEKYFSENASVITKMQEHNIPVSTTHTVENLNRNVISEGIGSTLGDWWQRLVNEPTFKKFLPSMEIEFWKDSYATAIKNKINPAVAEEVASKATKNFYGIITSDDLAKSSALGENLKSIFLFAPRYRETILNFLGNTIKGLAHPLAPENIANTKWLAGTIITYGLYDLANLKFNGHHMFQNPPGTEDKLLVPIGNGTTIGVSFASGILTIPKAGFRAGMALSRGDIGGAVGEIAQTGLAMGLKAGVDVARNQDYFGREITPQNADTGTKLKDYAVYIGLQTMHPYLKEALDPRYKDDPAYQRLSRAAEIPLRFYADKSLDSKWYYDSQDSVKRSLTSDQQKLYDQVYTNPSPTTQVGKIQQDQLEARILLAHPELLTARKEVVVRTASKTGQPVDPFFLLTADQQKVILQRQALNPGDSDNGLTTANIDWLKDYWTARSDYFDKLDLPQAKALEGPKLTVDPKIIDLQDQYFALPYGTGQRTAFLNAHPELSTYWDEKADYENALRVQMGLPEIPKKSYGSYQKKFSVKKSKPIVIKKAKKFSIPKDLFKAFNFKKAKKVKV